MSRKADLKMILKFVIPHTYYLKLSRD